MFRAYLWPIIRRYTVYIQILVEASWNVMTHPQKPDFVFRRNWRVHLNRRGRQFSRLLAAEVCPSAVVMLDTPCSEVVWRVLATHSNRQFPSRFPFRASQCAITFQLESTCCVFYLTVCWPTWPTDNTYQLLYIYSIPPDNGPQICPKHVEVEWLNKLRINSTSSWFLLHGCKTSL